MSMKQQRSSLDLKHQETLRERDKYVFHGSSAGSCYRKQMYSYYDYPSDTKDDKSYRLLRLGTLVHKDMEEALSMYEDIAYDRNNASFSSEDYKEFVYELYKDK